MTELHRAVRHGVGVFLAYFVSKGWLPEGYVGDITEVLVILFAWLIPYAWSWMRDRANGNS